MMQGTSIACSVLLGMVLLLTTKTSAAQSNFEGAQLGGRTSMMGGAAVASGADEATAFLNPAGITRIPGQSFSFSTFAAQLSRRTIKDPLDVNGSLGVSDPDVGRFRLRILPNTFCLFLNGSPKARHSLRSRHKYALCVASTERERLDFTKNRVDSSFGGTEISGIGHSTRMEFVRRSVALSWGLQLSKNTNIGVTFRTDNSRFSDQSSATSFATEEGLGQLRTLNLSRHAWSWDTSLILGFTWNLSSIITLGAALNTPSQHVVGQYTAVSSISTSDDSRRSITQDDGDFRYNHPGSLRLGLAFAWPSLLFEINGSFYGPQEQRARANFDRSQTVIDPGGGSSFRESRASVFERGTPVTNLAAGVEYFVEHDFSLIGGLQSDFSGIAPRQDTETTRVLFRQSKDTVYASAGVSTYGSQGRLLLGLRGSYSWGEALIADPTRNVPSFAALSQSEWSVGFVVSGHISFRAVRDAAIRAANPLAPSPVAPSFGGGKKPKEKK